MNALLHNVIPWLCVWAVAMLAIYGFRWRPKRRNRRRIHVPPPSKDTQRAPDWRSYWRVR